jgi:hypothetical protein
VRPQFVQSKALFRLEPCLLLGSLATDMKPVGWRVLLPAPQAKTTAQTARGST